MKNNENIQKGKRSLQTREDCLNTCTHNRQTSPKRRNAPYMPPTIVENIAYQICVSIK